MGALLAILMLLEGGPSEGAERAGRALMIGVDGASHLLIKKLIEAGDLPSLAALARTGSSGLLRADFPLLSPRIWTSVATGKEPEAHGIHNFIHVDPSGRRRLYSSKDRKAHAVWNILSDAGKTVGVVNWLISHPPEMLKGVMISDHAIPGSINRRLAAIKIFVDAKTRDDPGTVAAPERRVPFAHPPEWVSRFAAHVGNEDPLTPIPNPFSVGDGQPNPFATKYGKPAEGLPEALSDFFKEDALLARVALDVEAQLHPDLLMVYLPGVDRVSHFLWSALSPQKDSPEPLRQSPKDVARDSAALRDYYRHVDHLIGLLLARYGPDDLILVVSDHGFEARTKPEHPQGIHASSAARDGILYMRGPGLAPGSEMHGMKPADVAPTLLAWFGLPPAADMTGTRASFLRADALGSVPTYDSTPIERVRDDEPALEETIIEELRALGYVE